MTAPPRPSQRRRWPSRSRGIALLVVLAYLGLAALAAAGLLRDAAGSQRVLYPLAQDRLAQQMAEIGLRTCEAGLLEADGRRVVALQEASIERASVLQNLRYTGTAWTQDANWMPESGQPGAASLVVADLDDKALSWSLPEGSDIRPPECRVERVTLAGDAGTAVTYLVTARGFSPGYATDTEGRQTGGAVVWLQSLLSLSP